MSAPKSDRPGRHDKMLRDYGFGPTREDMRAVDFQDFMATLACVLFIGLVFIADATDFFARLSEYAGRMF